MHQQFICRNPAADPMDDVANSAAAIRAADWWNRAEMQEHWPLSMDEAVRLLAVAGEFDVGAADLTDLIQRRLLPSPGVDDAGALEWSAADIIAAGGLLEARGQWRATPSGHDPKKHPCQLILEQARAACEVGGIVDGPGRVRFDVPHLLALLAACDNREGRQKTIALLKAVLEVDHGVIIP